MKLAEIARRRLVTVHAYRRVFRTEDGKRVLADIGKLAGLDEDGFDPDASQMAYKAGQRSVALKIARLLQMTREELSELTGTSMQGDGNE